jgi:hypothetical protein
LPSFPEWQCLYLGDRGDGCIYKITSDKKVSVYAKDTPNAQNMFFDKNCVLFVAVGDGVRTVTPTEDGSPATLENGHVKVLVDGLHHGHGLARDKNGNLWFGTYVGKDSGKKNAKGQPILGQGSVSMVSPEGKLRTICRAFCYSLATDPAGDVYVCIQTGGVLARLGEDGTKTVVAKDFVCRGAIFDHEGTAYAVGVKSINKMTKDGKIAPIVDCNDEYGSQHP